MKWILFEKHGMFSKRIELILSDYDQYPQSDPNLARSNAKLSVLLA